SDSQKIRVRQLSVLDDKHHDNTTKKISSLLKDHQSYMKILKNKGYTIIGYCRRSDLRKREKISKAYCNK
ncbi:hypothetical protein BCV72DRAFT_328889, partial [Rhizopus microsporus var. microsporus]